MSRISPIAVIHAVGLPLVIALVQLFVFTVANVWLELVPTASCWVDALAVSPALL